jgi:hypothetical protein
MEFIAGLHICIDAEEAPKIQFSLRFDFRCGQVHAHRSGSGNVPTMMQALNAAMSNSCGFGAVFAPSNSGGSSAAIENSRGNSRPFMKYERTRPSLRVAPSHVVATLNRAKPFFASP